MVKTLGIMDPAYDQWVTDLVTHYQEGSLQTALYANQRLIGFYWYLGAGISHKAADQLYGERFYRTLSFDLRERLPGTQGLSETNIRYAKRFFELYKDAAQKTPSLVKELAQVPWGHHRCILDRCKKDVDKAVFYVKQIIENGWSRVLLLNFLDTDLYQRQGQAITNFKQTLPTTTVDTAQSLTRDPYNLQFLNPALLSKFNERQLKDALLRNITRFLTELGTGFAYVGREYRLKIGQKENFIDLLFYNLKLHCYVVIEVKIDEFDPRDIGQLGTYVAAANHLLREEGRDNPTIGLLICKSKDNLLAQYALESSSQPLGISEYELSKLYPADVEGTLPSVEEIEHQLRRSSEAAEKLSKKETSKNS